MTTQTSSIKIQTHLEMSPKPSCPGIRSEIVSVTKYAGVRAFGEVGTAADNLNITTIKIALHCI